MLRFLDNHRLDHTPAHFAFAHSYLFGSDPGLVEDVRAVVDGGVRISPAEVLRISSKREPRGSVGDVVGPQLDHMTVRVLDIIRDTLSATGDLNRDLVQASASLLAEDVPNVRAVVAAMIERTATAERSLSDATLQAQRLREELNALRSEANRDRLTGLLNRAALEDHLAAAPDGLCLALVDVDHFKRVNDTHGHGVGDRVLRAVAGVLSETCAPHSVGRWGGEEFMVLFERGELAMAVDLIDRARVALAAKRFRLREDDKPLGEVTFSAGVVSRRGRTVEATIAAADGLLYAAKSEGRNRVSSERHLVDVDARRAPRSG
ncbi:diguanylate cyclase [Sphingomonas sp. SFZ2018-12]|uniref:GGDEF domain-containing protein n=1 Tax=Sphingomonas sp. SFZ2018-12 TaxID=2683197 RepID=UPI001F0FA45D|nr:diguanylate cyclase [Sphingomonas sp. SFZ2018-12]